jgi:hypothetical protein
VQPPKTARPARELSAEPALNNYEQLGGPLDPSNNPNAAGPQAPDNSGESDFNYFSARPLARTRIRSAFNDEFPRKLLKPGGGRPAVVIVGIQRDNAGRPTTRVRSIVFPDGGTA